MIKKKRFIKNSQAKLKIIKKKTDKKNYFKFPAIGRGRPLLVGCLNIEGGRNPDGL